jgi:hypothetical protein
MNRLDQLDPATATGKTKLSAHAFIGIKTGLTQDDIAAARHAHARAEKTDAILKLARTIVVQRGELSDSDLKQARTAGLTDEDIVETIANVVLNIFTNYVNHVAQTAVDFPELKPGNGQMLNWPRGYESQPAPLVYQAIQKNPKKPDPLMVIRTTTKNVYYPVPKPPAGRLDHWKQESPICSRLSPG